jgi:hypothetical protein
MSAWRQLRRHCVPGSRLRRCSGNHDRLKGVFVGRKKNASACEMQRKGGGPGKWQKRQHGWCTWARRRRSPRYTSDLKSRVVDTGLVRSQPRLPFPDRVPEPGAGQWRPLPLASQASESPDNPGIQTSPLTPCPCHLVGIPLTKPARRLIFLCFGYFLMPSSIKHHPMPFGSPEEGAITNFNSPNATHCT